MNLLNLEFPDFSENSRVWFYMADKRLNSSQAEELGNAALAFCKNWKNHGKPIPATSLVIEDQIVIFLVEQDMGNLGGCSIDSSVNFLREYAEQYKVDFFNRMLFAYLSEDVLNVVPTLEVAGLINDGTIDNDTIVVNTLVQSRDELVHKLFVKFEDSWYTRFVK